jgi:hypothetical protein
MHCISVKCGIHHSTQKNWVDLVFLFSPSNKNRGKAFAVPYKKRIHHLFFCFCWNSFSRHLMLDFYRDDFQGVPLHLAVANAHKEHHPPDFGIML